MRARTSSSTIRRPPTAMAQVARMRPFSMRANFVVPPPMSTLSSVALWPRESATAPEPCAAIWHSMWCPAEAQTNLPASSEKAGELVDVDGVVAPIGRQQDRRLPEDFSLDHDKTARQRRRKPLQMHAREHQMRRRRADIDADGRQLDIIGSPGDLIDGDIVGADVKMLEFEIVH